MILFSFFFYFFGARDERGSPRGAMPVFVLYVKMKLENVAWVAPSEGARWCLDLESGAGHKEGIWVVPDEQHETAGGRSTANFVMTGRVRPEATQFVCGCA